MSTPDPATLAVTLAADQPSYTPGEALAVTVTAVKTSKVTVNVQVTLPDGSTGSGELEVPVQVPAAGFAIASATDSLGDSFTQEPAPDGTGIVLRTTLGTPAA